MPNLIIDFVSTIFFLPESQNNQILFHPSIIKKAYMIIHFYDNIELEFFHINKFLLFNIYITNVFLIILMNLKNYSKVQ